MRCIAGSFTNVRVWYKIADHVGEVQIEKAKECVKANTTQEIEATLEDGIMQDDQGGVGIAVSTNMGWKKKGEGNTYNSSTGNNAMFGCQTSPPSATYTMFCL